MKIDALRKRAQVGKRLLITAMALAFMAQTTLPIFGFVQKASAAPVCTYDFPSYKMWEINWGTSLSNRNDTPTFNKGSHGGLTGLNAGPVPGYMSSSPSWHWLYIVENQSQLNYTYHFADGTVRTANIVFSMVDGCSIPSVTWGFQAPTASQSNFIGDQRYIRANNGVDVASAVRVPNGASAVRFNFDGATDFNGVSGYEHIQAGQWPNGAGDRQFRVAPSLPGGQYAVTAEFQMNSTWYPVTGSNTIYSIDQPTALYVTPSPSRTVFRPSDNPVRLRVEDQFNQFSRMIVTVNGIQHTVLRDQCDLRQAGNYLFCDVKTASTWVPLAEGTYTASTTTYTRANNRVDNLISLPFTIDGALPTVSNFIVPPTASTQITVSAEATDLNGIKSVQFHLAQPEPSGECKNNLLPMRSAYGTLTSGNTYEATISTADLNGPYCVLVVAQDNATHHSVPLFRSTLIDNPVVTPEVLPPGGGTGGGSGEGTTGGQQGQTGGANQPVARVAVAPAQQQGVVLANNAGVGADDDQANGATQNQSTDNKDDKVLGTEAGVSSDASVKAGHQNGWLGLAWYVWLAILLAIFSLLWFVLAKKRRKQED